MKKYLSVALLLSALFSTAFTSQAMTDDEGMSYMEDEPVSMHPGDIGLYPSLRRRPVAGEETTTGELRGRAEFASAREQLGYKLERLRERLASATPAEKRKIRAKINQLKARLDKFRSRVRGAGYGRTGDWSRHPVFGRSGQRGYQVDVRRASIRPY